MSPDLLTLRLSASEEEATMTSTMAPTRLRPLDQTDAEALAALYLASYPPGVAAADLAEARDEMTETFAGTYGALRPDASATAWDAGRLVGAIVVVQRSIWDADLDGPFVIELFVDPDMRRRGIARALMEHAVAACSTAGDPALSLRVGEGTSASAHALYRRLGFVPVDEVPGH